MKSVEHAGPKYGGVFHWLEGGNPDGPPVCLLHGHMAHAIAFRRVWGPLAANFRLFIPDLPGHGADETFRGLELQPRIDTLADWLVDVVDVGVDRPVHLIGHSLGASIAYQAAAGQPERFRSLTLVSPGFCVRAPPGAATLLDHLPAAWVRPAISRVGMRIIEPFRWQGRPMGADEAQAYVDPLKDVERLEFALRLGAELMRRACAVDELAAVALPTMLLFGAGDDVVAVDRAAEIADTLEARRLEVLEHSGHSPPEDTPGAFVDVVTDFIADVSAETPESPG